ncbi:transposase [Streptomyces scabiei]|uniref:Transposase n=1 Tax=Streptomyces scabiei TaxID=1930 RepID=A0A100JIB1_STRSC|nr:ATP-binding protein [Streptomyces scabiei]GAQ60076.1 transposase [Streptomyces scabiei]
MFCVNATRYAGTSSGATVRSKRTARSLVASPREERAAQARDENWSHEEYLAALLQRQVADRESKGTVMRIRTVHFPQVKTLEDSDLGHLPSLRGDVLVHLATGTFVAKAENVILLGPPGIGKTHLAIGLGVKAAHAGYSVLFDTASNWITRLAEAHQAGRLEAELKKIRRYKLIIVDEVGYIPFDQDAANLFFLAHRVPLRAGLRHGDLEPALRALGRDLLRRRRRRRRRDDRPPGHHAEVLTLTDDSCRTRRRRELLAKENRAGRD